jgi:WD40 repeat protein
MESLTLECEEDDKDMFPEDKAGEIFPKAYHLSASAAVGLDETYVLHLDRNGTHFAAALSNTDLIVSDRDSLVTKQTHRKAHDDTISGLGFSKENADLLYSSSHDGTVKLWDLRMDSSKAAMTFSQEKTKTGAKPLTSFDSSRNGWLLCVGTEKSPKDAFLLFWDARNPKSSSVLGGYWNSHDDDVTAVRFHPTNADRMATSGTDGIVNVYDLTESNEDDALETSINTESSVQRLSWFHRNSSANDADSLCCLTHTEEAVLWRVDDVAPFKTFTREDACVGMRRKVTEVAYYADAFERAPGELLFLAGSSDEKRPCLRMAAVNKKASRMKSSADLARPRAKAGVTRCAAFDAVSGELVTGGEDGIVCLWKPGASGKEEEGHQEKVGGKAKKKGKKGKNPY